MLDNNESEMREISRLNEEGEKSASRCLEVAAGNQASCSFLHFISSWVVRKILASIHRQSES